jgi:hypothetical protein
VFFSKPFRAVSAKKYTFDHQLTTLHIDKINNIDTTTRTVREFLQETAIMLLLECSTKQETKWNQTQHVTRRTYETNEGNFTTFRYEL